MSLLAVLALGADPHWDLLLSMKCAIQRQEICYQMGPTLD